MDGWMDGWMDGYRIIEEVVLEARTLFSNSRYNVTEN
jgi:hypothetical protein